MITFHEYCVLYESRQEALAELYSMIRPGGSIRTLVMNLSGLAKDNPQVADLVTYVQQEVEKAQNFIGQDEQQLIGSLNRVVKMVEDALKGKTFNTALRDANGKQIKKRDDPRYQGTFIPDPDAFSMTQTMINPEQQFGAFRELKRVLTQYNQASTPVQQQQQQQQQPAQPGQKPVISSIFTQPSSGQRPVSAPPVTPPANPAKSRPLRQMDLSKKNPLWG